MVEYYYSRILFMVLLITNEAAGVHSCGILRRLEWRWGVVIYGCDQHLGTGWFATISQTPAEVCRKDLAWDYPGV